MRQAPGVLFQGKNDRRIAQRCKYCRAGFNFLETSTGKICCTLCKEEFIDERRKD